MRIRAAVLRGASAAYSLEDLELAPPGPGEVRVRVAGAGMCHTDQLPRIGLADVPIVCGHEGSGVVDAVGEGVSRLAVGDHVVLSFDSCGRCRPCVQGAPAYCDTFIDRNLTGRRPDGTSSLVDAVGGHVGGRWFGQSSFATHCLATERNAVKVDPSLPLELLGPLGCGVQTGAASILVAMKVRAGSSLVVFGAGAVGLSAVMAAAIAGAATVVAVDLHQHRLDLAAERGATHGVLGDTPDLLESIRDLTDGGADFSFDTTGVPHVMLHALGCLRMTGVCGYVGVQHGTLELDDMALVGKTVLGIIEGGADPQRFIPVMIDHWRAGRFPFDRLVETFPLDQIAAAEQSSLAGGTIKPVLIPER
ncbi:MAG: NAD(P)-dependent alcohol dehydrogenase [Actinomycetes bacterium]